MTDVLFLPGIIAPAAIRYAPLLAHLDGVNAITKDLELYAGDEPPVGYEIADEVRGVDAAADAAGFNRFHIYGHSGGGAVALAYAAARGERLLTLAVDEPASDFTEEDRAEAYWSEAARLRTLPEAEAALGFLKLQLAEGVQPPPPPPGAPPPWMAKRRAGIPAFIDALIRHRVTPQEYSSFTKPVLFTRGSRSHPHWIAMEQRLTFPDVTIEVFEGLHHLNTSHQAEPERTAKLLKALWERA